MILKRNNVERIADGEQVQFWERKGYKKVADKLDLDHMNLNE